MTQSDRLIQAWLLRVLGCGEYRCGVVDVRQGVADVKQPFVENDVSPVEGKCFSSAHAGADDHLEQVGEQVIVIGAVAQESRCLCRRPARWLVFGWARDSRVPGGVVRQASLPDRVVECAGECGHTAAEGGQTAVRGELFVDEPHHYVIANAREDR